MKFYITNHFKKQLKKLSKKYPNIKHDLIKSLNQIKLENEISISSTIFKIRIKSSNNNKGKSAGFRNYIYLYKKRNLILPLTIYSKSAKENLSSKELNLHLKITIQEILNLYSFI